MLEGFQRNGDHYMVTLSSSETNALREVFGQVTGLINHGQVRSDPALARLFPAGYSDDEQAANELRRLTEGSLRSTKVSNAQELLATLPGGAKNEGDSDQVELDADQAWAWLAALNDARLILGTRLELKEDTDLVTELDEAVAQDPAGQKVFAISVYHYLTFLQESLVQAVAAWDS